MKKLFSLWIVLAGVVMLSAAPASACQCQSLSERERFEGVRKDSAAIFVGRAAEVTHEFRDTLAMRVTFEIKQLWKGDRVRELIVYTEGNNCDPDFEVGREYLVYAFAVPGRPGRLEAWGCAGTGPAGMRGEEIRWLGKSKRPRAKAR